VQIEQGQTAVITGGASGIGLSLARQLATVGAQLLLADIEAPALDAAAVSLRAGGATVETAVCDVSDRDAVEALADLAYSTFGAVNFLANNAGVVTRHRPWGSLDDWDWVLGIDLMGVVYGVHSFVPRMLDGGEPGHVMNTASTAGLLAFPGIASYNVAKRGVIALSETMHHELVDTAVSVSVLCPGLVSTRIGESERNRPGADQPKTMGAGGPGNGAGEELTPDQVAEFVLDEIGRGTFWLLPHPHYGDQALEQARRRNDRGTPVIPRVNR
jgi:NAD(P)-dependent dehydrogenase (short-subunit alcohol dehydrogenase family)